MSRTISPSSKKPYGVARVFATWALPRSSYYAALRRQQQPRTVGKRGPRRQSDEEVVQQIRQVLDESVFHGEGYRKVWARLRHRNVRVWKERVLRLMRENQLLSPHRTAVVRPGNPHDGTILVESPNQLWGTDATAAFKLDAPEGKYTARVWWRGAWVLTQPVSVGHGDLNLVVPVKK